MILFTALISCSTENDLPVKHSYTYQVPEHLDDKWQVSSLESEGINENLLEDMVNYIYDHLLYTSLRDIIIIKNGKLVFEEYFAGNSVETPIHLQSATKSITSAIFGIALDQGHVGSVDDRVYSYFPEYADSSDSQKDSILLRHILTMTPGFEWNETSTSLFSQENDNIFGQNSGDYIAHLLGKSLVTEPGSNWNYNSGCAMVLAGIIKKTTGMHIDEFGEKYLFHPLGVENHRWEYQDDGLPIAMGGFWMRPRDIAKVGELFLQGGTFDDERMISESWVEASLTEHTTINDDWNYGYQWWTGQNNTSIGEDFNDRLWFASGYGGQLIIVIQDSNAVIVVNGVYHRDADKTNKTENNIWFLLRNYILPSL